MTTASAAIADEQDVLDLLEACAAERPEPRLLVWCDGHDALAAFEAHWVDLTDPRDPRGISTPFCPAAECRARVLAMVEQHGVLQEVAPC